MVKVKKEKEKDKTIEQRWKDYAIALLSFIVRFFLWILIGATALWTFKNKSSEASLPIDPTQLPYSNPEGYNKITSAIDNISDIPMFSYNPPVGFPYSWKSKDPDVWEGFGNWFSRTEISSWSLVRNMLLSMGKSIASIFIIANKGKLGKSTTYMNLMELAGVLILPFFVILGLVIIQPISTTLMTIYGSFADNSWLWGIIGILLPIWIINIFNVVCQNLSLLGYLFIVPLFTGGFTYMRKLITKNKMLLLCIILIAAIIIASEILPGGVVYGMTVGFVMILIWHCLVGPKISNTMNAIDSGVVDADPGQDLASYTKTPVKGTSAYAASKGLKNAASLFDMFGKQKKSGKPKTGKSKTGNPVKPSKSSKSSKNSLSNWTNLESIQDKITPIVKNFALPLLK